MTGAPLSYCPGNTVGIILSLMSVDYPGSIFGPLQQVCLDLPLVGVSHQLNILDASAESDGIFESSDK